MTPRRSGETSPVSRHATANSMSPSASGGEAIEELRTAW
jgi:hypothetical protein